MKRSRRWTYTVVCVMMAIGRFGMIDWSREIETVDGVPAKVRWPEQINNKDSTIEVIVSGDDEVSRTYNREGIHYAGASPKIRNVYPTPDERAVAPELVARLVEFAQRVASDIPGGRDRFRIEARAIIAALEPVDPMLLEARKIVADQYGESGNVAHLREQALSGEGDEWFHTKVALAALRRGRALASRDVSRDVTPCTREQFEEDCRA